MATLTSLLLLPRQSVVLHESIGRGGHSEVWRATYTNEAGQSFRAAAKKVISCSIDDKEIHNMTQMNHENIIKFYGVWRQNEENVYIVMELAERGNLRNFLNRCKEENMRPTAACVLKWTYQAACALQYLKRIKHSHCDIKSLNFLIMEDYTLKLGDMGLATELFETRETRLKGGTCPWMAPEVYSKSMRSPKSDIFSLAIVVWEIISTDTPYAGCRGSFQVMTAVCAGKRPEIPTHCPQILRCIMTNCWDGERTNRPDIDEICQILLRHQCEVKHYVESISAYTEPSASECTTDGTEVCSSTRDDMKMKAASSSSSTDVTQHLQGLVVADEDEPSHSHLPSTAESADKDVPVKTETELPLKQSLEEAQKPNESVAPRRVKSAPSSSQQPGWQHLLASPPTIQHYEMRNVPHGLCIIINNIDFSVARIVRQNDNFKDRLGSQVDAEKLQNLFESLNFKVEVFTNLNASDMYDRLDEKRRLDHSYYDCFVCCILTHGCNGQVFGCDGELQPILELTKLFRANICKSLSGKPKFFIFEACQGSKKQGTTLEHDGPTKDETIPNESDFVLGYATVPGHVAYRHTTRGSWYINVLVDTFRKAYEEHDILTLLTMVNKNLSGFEDTEGKKQTASVFNTLRKSMYLCDHPDESECLDCLNLYKNQSIDFIGLCNLNVLSM